MRKCHHTISVLTCRLITAITRWKPTHRFVYVTGFCWFVALHFGLVCSFIGLWPTLIEFEPPFSYFVVARHEITWSVARANDQQKKSSNWFHVFWLSVLVKCHHPKVSHHLVWHAHFLSCYSCGYLCRNTVCRETLAPKRVEHSCFNIKKKYFDCAVLFGPETEKNAKKSRHPSQVQWPRPTWAVSVASYSRRVLRVENQWSKCVHVLRPSVHQSVSRIKGAHKERRWG